MPDFENAVGAGFLGGARWGRDAVEAADRTDLPTGVIASVETIVPSSRETTAGAATFMLSTEAASGQELWVRAPLESGIIGGHASRNKVAPNHEILYHNAIDLRRTIEAKLVSSVPNPELRKQIAETTAAAALEWLREQPGGAVTDAFSAAAEEGKQEASAVAELPPIPTEKYVGNRGGHAGGENIVEFLRRVWMPWIEAGQLNRPNLRKLDPKADEAITNWRRSRQWPSDLDIPSKAELTERRAMLAPSDPSIQRAILAMRQRERHSQKQ